MQQGVSSFDGQLYCVTSGNVINTQNVMDNTNV